MALSLSLKELDKLGTKGALVVLQPDTCDLLAAVSYPWPEMEQFAAFRADPDRNMERELFDRARFGLYPPGSSFKIVTAIAALRHDPALVHQSYKCIPLDHGRVGNYIGSSRRPVRDDVEDRTPHGTLEMGRAITVSCNAYFAQLGTYNVGARNLLDTAAMFGINAAHPDTPAQLQPSLPQAAYGQGQVVATPFDMVHRFRALRAHGKENRVRSCGGTRAIRRENRGADRGRAGCGGARTWLAIVGSNELAGRMESATGVALGSIERGCEISSGKQRPA